MKHQGQTMSETISMVSVGSVCIRWSFLLEVPASGPGADCALQDVYTIPS